jgi:hypothetical protein
MMNQHNNRQAYVQVTLQVTKTTPILHSDFLAYNLSLQLLAAGYKSFSDNPITDLTGAHSPDSKLLSQTGTFIAITCPCAFN